MQVRHMSITEKCVSGRLFRDAKLDLDRDAAFRYLFLHACR